MQPTSIQKGEEAKRLFLSGYNCAQAVFLAFSGDLGLDQTTALKISSCFGGGMGRMHGFGRKRRLK